MGNTADQSKTVRIRCNSCGQMTNHSIEGSYKTHWEDEEADVNGGGTHQLLKCCGCEVPTLRSVTWFSEDTDNNVEFHPPRNGQTSERKPKQFEKLRWGCPLDTVYRQTLSAFEQGLLTLAGAGVRLVIEGICKDQHIDGGPVTNEHGKVFRRKTLEGKINGLVEKEFIVKKQAETLHEIRFLGNDAAHELYQPSSDVVETAIDIVEHLLAQVYDQPEKGKSLAARRRPKK